MLIEVKVKVARIIDGKTRKRTETYVVDNCELFVNAEHEVMSVLSEEQSSGTVDNFEIQCLKISPIKEVCTEYSGEFSYMATLRDVFITDDGTEKELKYKVLLWADSLSEAMARTNVFARQGYDMNVDGLKEVNYEYLNGLTTEEESDE
jgi:hypothetical protein